MQKPRGWDLKTAKGIEMNLYRFLILVFLCAIGSCNPDDPGTDPGKVIEDPRYGSIDFNFTLPELNLPDKGLHRIDLSLAKTLDSLYRKQFCHAANVSDYKSVYRFTLLPGKYFYQAGITCTCQADSCLYAGFPGGKLTIWWTSGWVNVEKGKVFSKNLIFQ
jgi:hypothetical protein